MKVIVLCVWIWCALDVNSLIIPDELPSILSVIYSNIPTIKKGTDSRLGWGFRLGNRADFQVLLELGPQTNTQPLANQGENASSKRNTLNNLANTLYAQRQQEKRLRKDKIKQQESKQVKTPSNTQGAEWLNTWSKTVDQSEENEPLPIIPKPGLAIGEIDAKSVIPEDEYLPDVKIVSTNVTTEKTPSTTSKEDALDNVDLD